MAKRALFVATVGGFLGFERSDMGILQSMGYEVHCAANFKGSPLDDFKADGVIRHQVDFARIPWRRTNIAAYRQLKALLARGRFDLVHCHTPMGGVVARIAAQPYRKKKGTRVIYTAHGFHFFKGAPLKNWLLYFPVEWLLAHWTDVLITINREDYRLAKRCMRAGRVEYIPGVGVDTKKFSGIAEDPIETRKRLGVAKDDVMLLSVGELSERKNMSIVIRALSRLDDERIKYFICGSGPLEDELRHMIRELGLEGRVFLLGFRDDISALCHAADLFVFPSLQEGLPVALMEAVASRTPVICSRIRGNIDLVTEERDLFDPEDVDSVASCICDAMGRDMDRDVAANYERLKRYDMEVVAEKMKEEYANVASGMGGYNDLERIIARQAIRRRLGFSEDDFVVISVGELNDNKNHETVIRAIGMLNMPQVKYVVCGKGEKELELRNMIAESGLDGRVVLAGYTKNVRDYLYASDIFAFPSKREGLGLAAIEAMAAGLPVLTSDVGGINDFSQDGVTGYKRKSDDVTGFATAIKMLYKDREMCRRMGKGNKSLARKFDVDRISKMMEKIYLLSNG